MKKKGKTNFQKTNNKKSPGASNNFSEIIENPKKWYEQFSDDPTDFPPVPEEKLVELKREAKELHDSETLAFNTKNAKTSKSSDYEWIKTVLVKGTVSDKIAAYTVLIQDNPVYNLKSIQHLVGMVKVSKKNECLQVMQTLSELFLQDLLRADEKLKAFHEQPLSLLDELTSGNIVSRKRRLVLWYFEDQLKETYMTFVQALIVAARDSVDATKEKAITSMSSLLAGNPEQEKLLLTSIVNKLGDPSQKVASKTIYCLSQLLYKHPNMKQVVLMEIEKLLFRSNVPQRAQYYSICFLSQYYLTHDDFEVAKHLITVYFAFFKACVKKNEVDSRMMSALLMGVNRVYPYAKLELSQVSEHIDTLYKVVHQANFNVSLHALNLLFQVCDLSNSVNDRFYSALYKKLMDQNINNTTHQALFLNLIFKALKKDTSKHRVNVFIKRLLQIALNCSVPMACAILYTISQVSRFKKHNLLLNHHAVIKQESEVEREDQQDKEKESDTEEMKEMNEGMTNVNENKSDPNITKQNDKNDFLTVNVGNEPVVMKQEQDSENIKLKRNFYDPFHRNPLYAGGEYCILTELSALQDHFHPTVALFSKNLATGQKIVYTGDPLKDFTLIRFLDRFVFKNPKKIDTGDEYDKHKYKGYHFKFGQRKEYAPRGLRALPIRSKTYLKEVESKIPVDELFMYRFLQKKIQNQEEKDENDEDEAESDLDSVGSDEFNEMLDKMMGLKKRKAGEDEDDDIDYMNELGDSLKAKKAKTSKNASDEEESEDENGEEFEMDEDEGSEDEIETEDFEDDDNKDDENDDIEMGSEDEELIGDLDDDLSEMEFDDEDDNEDDDDGNEESYKTLSKKMKKKFSKKDDIGSAFASAEEFSMMLENTAASKFKSGSAQAMSNKDKADDKQIDWEQRRNQWISGYKQAMSGKKKFSNKKSGKVKEKKKFKNNKNNKKKIKKNEKMKK